LGFTLRLFSAATGAMALLMIDLVKDPMTVIVTAVIASYVENKDISLLVMGAYGHSRIRHLVIGSTTAQMLRSSHIPVLLFR
jgi:nucleotide-binding universal stress UspA family protein